MSPKPARPTVHDAANELVALSDDIVDLLLLRSVTLADELQRVSRSLSSAIAEASGAPSRQTRLDLFRTALRTASDCATLLDSCRCLAGAGMETINMGCDLVRQIVSVLTLLASGCDCEGGQLGEIPTLRLHQVAAPGHPTAGARR